MPPSIPLGVFRSDTRELVWYFKSKNAYVSAMGFKRIQDKLMSTNFDEYPIGQCYLKVINIDEMNSIKIDVTHTERIVEILKQGLPWNITPSDITTVLCRGQCGETKPWTKDNFSRESNPDGSSHLRTTCRECRRASHSSRIEAVTLMAHENPTFTCKGNDDTESHEAPIDTRLSDRDQCKTCYTSQRSSKTVSHVGEAAGLRERFNDVYDVCRKCGKRRNVGKHFVMRAGSKLGYRKLCLRDCQ